MQEAYHRGGASDVAVFLLGVEAGAVFLDAGEVAVAEDDGLGVVFAQGAQQGVEGGFLLGGAGVPGAAFLVETAFVADADGVLVVVADVGTGQVLVARLVQLAVAGDVVVVAGEAEAGVVTGYERRHGEGLRLARRRAVDDD